jgi:hypothetical protein
MISPLLDWMYIRRRYALQWLRGGRGGELETAGAVDREASIFDDLHALLSLVSEAFDAVAKAVVADNDQWASVIHGAQRRQLVERRTHGAERAKPRPG